MSLSPRNKANLKLSSLSSTSSHHHSQSPKAKPLVACHHRGGGRRSSDANDEEAEGKSQSGDQHHLARSKTSDWNSQECSMCGDVGFPTELFQCKKCLHRFQHTYCSRYYPSIPELDVCDWCSQDANRSAGSSTATTTITGTTTSMKTTRISKPPPRTLVTNLGKRKVIAAAQGDYSPSSSSPRKNCSSELHNKSPKKLNNNNNNLKSSNNNMINSTTTTKSSAKGVNRNSNHSLRISEEEEHKDALEVLLEVAQKVAEGQMINTWSSGDGGIGVDKTSTCWDITKQDVQHKQQQQQQHHQKQAEHQQGLISRHSNMTAFNKSSQGSLHLPASTKRQKLDNPTGSASVSSGVGDGVKHQVGAASTSGNKDHKLQLTNSRSIGRRYKLLSDVLCPKVAASNS